MRVRILGTAAGGGLPQWNCACECCAEARARGVHRMQDCVAVSGDGHAWYLLNASPDLRQQLLSTPELAPGPGRRETPVRGVLLSTAELDHTLGLLTLREAQHLTVYASSTVLDALPFRAILDAYTKVAWQPLHEGDVVELDGGLRASAVVIGAKRPRYATGLGTDWVIAYRLSDPATGGVLVYAPCIPAWSETLAAALADADCALLDGTFLTADEMPGIAGHLPINELLELLPRRPDVRYLFTHLNNTNPAGLGTIRLPRAQIADEAATITL